MRIPKDFPVRPLKDNQKAKDKATCGTCLTSWDDAIPTTWTPTPSGRCPFEYFHTDKMYREPKHVLATKEMAIRRYLTDIERVAMQGGSDALEIIQTVSRLALDKLATAGRI